MILVVLTNGEFYVTNFDINNHYEQNILVMEKYDKDKVWTAILNDADNGNMPYIKRFLMDASVRHQNFLGDNPASTLIMLTDTPKPQLTLTFSEPDTFRGPQTLDAEEFIAVKGFKAKGKRLTTYALDQVVEEKEDVEEPDETTETVDEETETTMETADEVVEETAEEAEETAEEVVDEVVEEAEETAEEEPEEPVVDDEKPTVEEEKPAQEAEEPQTSTETAEETIEAISDEEYRKHNPPHDDQPIQLTLF